MKRSILFKVISIAFFLLIILPQPGCKKDKNEPEPEPEFVIADHTKVISEEDWNVNIVSIDTTDYTLTFNEGINQIYDLSEGDIIVSSAGYGLLRKLTKVTTNAGKLVLTTEEAALSDAIIKGKLEYTVEVSNPGKIKRILYQSKGVHLLQTDKSGEGGFTVGIDEDLGTDWLTISGELTLSDFRFGGYYDWHCGGYFCTRPVLDTCNVHFGLNESLTLSGAISKSIEIKLKQTIFKAEYPTIVVMVGTVPVTITPVLSLVAGVDVNAESSLSAGVTQTLETSGGIAYNGSDWYPSFSIEKDFSPIAPSLSNTLSAKIYIKPQLSLKIYRVFCPNVSVQPYGLLEAELEADPWWYLYAGLRADIGLKIDVVIAKLLNINYNLFDKKFEIANSGNPGNHPPEASFTVDPQSGGIGTNFQFDASGCKDEEDVLEELMVRWDWEDDGEWDTEYSSNKKATHAYSESGNYTVQLEVEDTEGAKDKISKQVHVSNNNAPVAVFTVEPAAGATGSVFSFDYSGSHDEEDGVTYLEFRWDWEGDGIWDTDFEDFNYNEITHIYAQSGDYNVKLQVKDTDGAIGDTTRTIQVLDTHAPVAAFTIEPETGTTATVFTFDASVSSDEETPTENLEVRWNWSNDTEWDTDWSTDKVEEHQYSGAGTKTIKLIVRDADGYTNIISHELTVDEFEGVPCPGISTVDYGGKVYHTLLIGDQCWMKENLNIGTMIPLSTAQTDNSIIEKYCYEDDEGYCNIYGALYQWNELMQYTDTSGGQGLCPLGWHVPTDGEWKILEGTVDSQFGVGDPEWDNTGKRGYDAGLNLKSDDLWQNGGNGIDIYKFFVLPAGYGNFVTGNFYQLGKEGIFWTSTKGYDEDEAFRRKFSYNSDKIERYYYNVQLNRGYSVRCIMDDDR